MPYATALWRANLATMRPGAPYGAVPDGALAIVHDRIAYAGPAADLPAALIGPDTAQHDMRQAWITPALIDCHTHLIFAGNRAHEWEGRLAGHSYAQAARDGGGILATMRATRAATEAQLIAIAQPRLAAFAAEGTATIEIKSGYGLDVESELKMLRAARALGRQSGLRIRTTLLAAHATPPEFAGRPNAYIDHVINDILPAAEAEHLVDAVDAFAEAIAFTPNQIRRLFVAAKAHDLPVKLHADQLTDGDGAALAAEHQALSADHLEYTNEAGVRAMAAAGTVAVLLPGAYLTVGASQPPPLVQFRTNNVPIAIGTDCNPGSSPLTSPLVAASLACALFRLTPEEALAGLTRNAARALGLAHETGTLAPGLAADFAVWGIDHPRDLAYWLAGQQPQKRVIAGLVVA